MVISLFYPHLGGAEQQALRLARGLISRGISVTVLTRKTKELASYEVIQGVPVYRHIRTLPWGKLFGLTFLLSLFWFLLRKRHTYDIIHSHQCFYHAVLGTVVARCLGKKSIVKIACAGQFGDLKIFSQSWGFPQALNVLQHTDALIAISTEVEKELQTYGFTPGRIYRIPNGVDTDEFKRDTPFPDSSKHIFILVGRRAPQKGVDIALQALALLLTRGFTSEQICLKLYGLDYPEHDYRHMAEQLGVSSMVDFLPPTTAVKGIYTSAHVLILPSRGEGLANVLLEAMSLKMPIIAASVSGTIDVMQHNINGILIKPDDAQALAQAMEAAMQNPQHFLHLGEQARQKVVQDFSLQQTITSYTELYRKLSGR